MLAKKKIKLSIGILVISYFSSFSQNKFTLHPVVQTRHTNIIEHYTTNQTGKLLLTSDNLTCKLWNIKTGSLLRTFDAQYATFNKNGDILTIKSLGEDYSEVSITQIDTLSVIKSVYVNASYEKLFWKPDSTAILINSGRNNFSECGNVLLNPQTLEIIHSFNAYNVITNQDIILVVNYIRNTKGGGRYSCSNMDFSGKVQWTKPLPERFISCCSTTNFYIQNDLFIFDEFSYLFNKQIKHIRAYNVENGRKIKIQNYIPNQPEVGFGISNIITLDKRTFGIDKGYSGSFSRFVEILDNKQSKFIANDIAYIGASKDNKQVFLSQFDGTFKIYDLKLDSIYRSINVKESITKIKNGFLLGNYFYFFTEDASLYSLNVLEFKLTQLTADFLARDLNISVNHELEIAIFYSETYTDNGNPTIKQGSKYYCLENNQISEKLGRPLCMSADGNYLVVETISDISLLNLKNGEKKTIVNLKEKSINIAQISPDEKYIALAIGNKFMLYNIQNETAQSKIFIFDEQTKTTLDLGKNYYKSTAQGYDRIVIKWHPNSQNIFIDYRGLQSIFKQNLNLKLEDIGVGAIDHSGKYLILLEKNILNINQINSSNSSKKHTIGADCSIRVVDYNKVCVIKSDQLSILDIVDLKETQMKSDPDDYYSVFSDYKVIKTVDGLRLIIFDEGSVTYFDVDNGNKIKQIKLPTNNYKFVHLNEGKYSLAYDEIYVSQMYKINNETGDFQLFPPGHLPIFSSPLLIGEVFTSISNLYGSSFFSNHRSIYAKNLPEVYLNNPNNKYIFTYSLNGSFHLFNLETNELILSITLSQDQYLLLAPDNYYAKSTNLSSINFARNQKLYDFEQFDLKYNRPDIILERLEIGDVRLKEAYKNAYLKRLRKLGFTEEMLMDDFHIPELQIKQFEQLPNTTHESFLELNIKATDSIYKLDKINIWINDVAIYGTSGISIRDKDISEIETKLTIPLAKGNNKIQISVLNLAGAESYKETVNVNCKTGKTNPNLYVVSLGVSKFKNKSFNLKFAAKDAEDIAKMYTNHKNYGKVFTKSLTNQEVTKENIEQLREFLKAADRNDEVIVFFAGHGVLDAQLDYYLASFDMDFSNPADRGIAYESLERLLDGIAPLKKILLIDACHSGEIDKDEVAITTNTEVEEGDVKFRNVGNTIANKESHLSLQNTSELTKSLFADLRKGTGATVISSAGGMEFAMESSQWQNGLFTYCYINGLQSKAADLNKDGVIMLSELQQYVATQVTKLSNGKQQPTSRIENNVLDWKVW